jgi:hypothetical protein
MSDIAGAELSKRLFTIIEILKGIKVPCAAIFNTIPTDRGICCSFNLVLESFKIISSFTK